MLPPVDLLRAQSTMLANGGEAVRRNTADEQQHPTLPHATVSDMVSAVSAFAKPIRRELGWTWHQHQYC